MHTSSLSRFTAIASAFFASTSFVSAVTLRLTITNTAPVDSIAIAGAYLSDNLTISDVVVTPGMSMMGASLPELNLNLAFQPTGSVFPSVSGGSGLPSLLPGDSVSFLLSGADFLGATSLFYGVDLISNLTASDADGNFMQLNFTTTAGEMVNFSPDGMGGNDVMIGGMLIPGGAGLQSATQVLAFSAVAVPEPGIAGWGSMALLLGWRRSRAA